MKELAWITGAAGLIGSELVRSAPNCAPGFVARGLARAEIDLLDFRAVEQLFRKEKPSLLIHCAAMSRNLNSQTVPELARKVNVDATGMLVQLAAEAEVPFLFFSTDLVFDGTQGNYVEADRPNPLSPYAETKVAGEQLVRAYPRHWIMRISLTGGKSPKGDRGFNEEMKNAWKQGRVLNLFVDEFRCPLGASVVARAVWELSTSAPYGTYHLCSPEKLSRFQIGQLLAERHPDLNPKIEPGSRKDYQGPPRPADTSLNCSKLQQILSFPLPRFSEWLREDQTGF